MRVKGILEKLQVDNDDMRKRTTAAGAAGKLADDPELTADLRQKLIEALNKMVESDNDAERQASYKEALAKLQGSGSG